MIHLDSATTQAHRYRPAMRGPIFSNTRIIVRDAPLRGLTNVNGTTYGRCGADK